MPKKSAPDPTADVSPLANWLSRVDQIRDLARQAEAATWALGPCPDPDSAQDMELLLARRAALGLPPFGTLQPGDYEEAARAAAAGFPQAAGALAHVLGENLARLDGDLPASSEWMASSIITPKDFAGDLAVVRVSDEHTQTSLVVGRLLDLPPTHPARAAIQPEACPHDGHKQPLLYLGPPLDTVRGPAPRAWYQISLAVELTRAQAAVQRRDHDKALAQVRARQQAEVMRPTAAELAHQRIATLEARVAELEGRPLTPPAPPVPDDHSRWAERLLAEAKAADALREKQTQA